MQVLSSERAHKDRRDLYNLKSMLPFITEYWGRAVFALVCLVLSKVANVGVPIVLKDLVDYFENTDLAVVVLPVSLLLAYGALKLAASLFNELRDVVFARVRYHAMRRLSTSVLSKLHDLSLRFHLERKSGAISRNLERGTRSVSSIMNYLVFSIFPIMVEFTLVATILLINYDIVFTLVTFGTVLAYIAFTLAVTEWRMEYRHEMNRLDSEANSHALDSLMNYETVKYFNNEEMEMHRYDNTLTDWEGMAVKSQSTMSLLNFGQGSVIAIGVTGTMFYAVEGVADGSMSIGDLVLVNAFMLQLFIPLNFLGIVYRQIKYSLADMDLIFKLLEEKPEVQDVADAPDLVIGQGKLEFNQVDFAYQPERPILHKVSFSIQPGEKLAVVGHSGAGKSTLSRLFFRFYDIQAGEILIDQQNIALCTQASVRKCIGIVPQDTVLFNESIYYNILYGRPDASRQEVKQAASDAQLADFIGQLPGGWDTIVGERGLKLSGGEKQRVAIARAILKDPKIMIFDEATSSLDSGTEKAILSTLTSVSKNRTTLVIAHRLSTIVDADSILVMDKGSIIEQGRHSELMASNGEYARMWELQQQEENDDG